MEQTLLILGVGVFGFLVGLMIGMIIGALAVRNVHLMRSLEQETQFKDSLVDALTGPDDDLASTPPPWETEDHPDFEGGERFRLN